MLLAETTDQGWRPGIGDPTFVGWFTVLAYAIAALLCYRAYRAARQSESRRDRFAARLWFSLAVLMGLLAINKQLDLQSWFTQVGRSMAKSEGWYQDRQFVQVMFIAALTFLGIFAIAWLAWATARQWHTYGMALMGAAFIVTFVIVRAASFHHIDEFLGWEWLGFRMNWILELGGISLVAASAARNVKPRSSGRVAQPQPEKITDRRESFEWMVRRMREWPNH